MVELEANAHNERKLRDVLKEKIGKQWISFEYFPPKTADGVKKLYERLERMKAYEPVFVDFTWGAGGSTADLTLELTIEAKERFGLLPNMHLTCTNMPIDKVSSALNRCKEAGIRNILALRGDPPAGQERWEAVEGGLGCALDLVTFIRQHYGDYFSVAVAGYPEGHPNRISQVDSLDGLSDPEKRRCSTVYGEDGKIKGYCVCRDADYEKEIDYLRKKVDAGADAIITQLFMDVSVYVDFVRACRAAGITVPIIPGIMCISNVGGFKRMVTLCKTRVPPSLWRAINELPADDEEAVRAFGIAFGIDLCTRVMQSGAGVPGIHLYTLNLEKVPLGIVEGLGLGARAPSQRVAQHMNLSNVSKIKEMTLPEASASSAIERVCVVK